MTKPAGEKRAISNNSGSDVDILATSELKDNSEIKRKRRNDFSSDEGNVMTENIESDSSIKDRSPDNCIHENTANTSSKKNVNKRRKIDSSSDEENVFSRLKTKMGALRRIQDNSSSDDDM